MSQPGSIDAIDLPSRISTVSRLNARNLNIGHVCGPYNFVLANPIVRPISEVPVPDGGIKAYWIAIP
jgi:hypothetical protein